MAAVGEAGTIGIGEFKYLNFCPFFQGRFEPKQTTGTTLLDYYMIGNYV